MAPHASPSGRGRWLPLGGAALLRITSAGFTLGAQVAYVRWFGATDFGLQVQVMAIAAAALSLFGWGVDRVVVREMAPLSDRSAAPAALRALACTQLALAACGLLALALYLLVSAQPGPLLTLTLAAALMAAQFGAAIGRAQDRHLAVDTVELMVRPVLALLLTLLLGRCSCVEPGWAVAAGTVAAQCLVALLHAWRARALLHAAWRSPVGPVPDGLALPRQLIERLPYALLGVVSYAMFQLDTLALSHTLTPAELAGYGLATGGAKIVSFFPTILATQRMPALARTLAEADSMRRAWLLQRQTERSAWLAGGLGLLLAVLLGRSALQLVDPGFVQAYPALCLLCAGHLAQSVSGCRSNFLAMARREHVIVRAQVLGAVVAVLGYAVLIPMLGMTGAACAAALAMIVVHLTLRASVRHLHA